MTFAAAERAYLSAPEPDSCQWCEDDDSLDHDDCRERAQDEADQAAIERAEARREGGEDWLGMGSLKGTNCFVRQRFSA